MTQACQGDILEGLIELVLFCPAKGSWLYFLRCTVYSVLCTVWTEHLVCRSLAEICSKHYRAWSSSQATIVGLWMLMTKRQCRLPELACACRLSMPHCATALVTPLLYLKEGRQRPHSCNLLVCDHKSCVLPRQPQPLVVLAPHRLVQPALGDLLQPPRPPAQVQCFVIMLYICYVMSCHVVCYKFYIIMYVNILPYWSIQTPQ